jgi:hypothetical protein
MRSKHLRVEVAGFTINDYRINKGHLELRMLDPRGRSCTGSRSSWKQLNASDIAFHFTLVAHWFQDKLGISKTELAILRRRRENYGRHKCQGPGMWHGS